MNWAFAGCVGMLLTVAIGAFAAHGLKTKLPVDMLTVFETGVRYQAYHSLALFAVAWLAEKSPGAATTGAGWLFMIGIVVFSGSLYVLSVTGLRWLGAITPLGGLCFLAGWACLATASFRG